MFRPFPKKTLEEIIKSYLSHEQQIYLANKLNGNFQEIYTMFYNHGCGLEFLDADRDKIAELAKKELSKRDEELTTESATYEEITREEAASAICDANKELISKKFSKDNEEDEIVQGFVILKSPDINLL